MDLMSNNLSELNELDGRCKNSNRVVKSTMEEIVDENVRGR